MDWCCFFTTHTLHFSKWLTFHWNRSSYRQWLYVNQTTLWVSWTSFQTYQFNCRRLSFSLSRSQRCSPKWKRSQQITNSLPWGSTARLFELNPVVSYIFHILRPFRYDCEGILQRVFVGKRLVENPCQYSEEIITDIGYCVSLTFRDLSADATDSIEIEVSSSEIGILNTEVGKILSGSISFQVHPHGSHSNMKSKRRFLKKAHRSIISLKISTVKPYYFLFIFLRSIYCMRTTGVPVIMNLKIYITLVNSTNKLNVRKIV